MYFNILSFLVTTALLFSSASSYRIFPLDPPRVPVLAIKPSPVVHVYNTGNAAHQLVKAVPVLEPTKEDMSTRAPNVQPTPAIIGDEKIQPDGIHHGKLSTSDHTGAIVPTSVVLVRETFDLPSTELRPPKL